MKKNPTISVIIPVFNAELYLAKCIDSLLVQTFDNFELILINDGSSDSSLEICLNYKKKDKRVKVFSQSNKGVSSARNMGLSLMVGEFSIQVDSDDWVDKDYLFILYRTALLNSSQIVSCDIIKSYSNEQCNVIEQDFGLSKQEVLLNLLKGSFHGSLANKLIKNSLIIENNLSFVEGITISEDLCFTVQCYKYAERINHVNIGLYYYRMNNESITHNISIDKVRMKIDNVKLIEAILGDQFESGFVYQRLYAKFELLFQDDLYNPNRWRIELPVKFADILKCKIQLKYKVVYLFTKLHIDMFSKLYIYLRTKKYE